MTSIKKSIMLACAASVLSFGVAMAQTDPNAAPPAGGSAPAADQGAAPAADAGAPATPAPKKKKTAMKKGHKKHAKKKAM